MSRTIGAPYANVAPPAQLDGIPYSVNAQVPFTEGDLFNASGPASTPTPPPIAVSARESLVADVVLTAVQNVVPPTYVVLQTDLGDGVWIDLAWVVWQAQVGAVITAFSTQVSVANVFQQTRAAGQVPATALGFNACNLGGRIRFVGRTGQPPSASASPAGISASPSPSAKASAASALKVSSPSPSSSSGPPRGGTGTGPLGPNIPTVPPKTPVVPAVPPGTTVAVSIRYKLQGYR